MSFKNRLRLLEEDSAGACGRCYSAASLERVYAFYPDSEAGDPAPELPTCSGCGRSLGVALRVVYGEAEGEGSLLE